MPAATAFAHEFTRMEPPQRLAHRLVIDGTAAFDRCGYKIESHTDSGLTLARRASPSWIMRAPVGIAVLLAAIGAASGSFGALEVVVALVWMLIIASIVRLFVRRTDRVTITVSPHDTGSHVLISGQATPALRRHLLDVERNSPGATSANEPTPQHP